MEARGKGRRDGQMQGIEEALAHQSQSLCLAGGPASCLLVRTSSGGAAEALQPDQGLQLVPHVRAVRGPQGPELAAS